MSEKVDIDLRQGDCQEVMKDLPDNSVDVIVTDPPYGINFMAKKWDYAIPSIKVWQEAIRVLKPGGHMLCACGTRTQHRMACNIEDAGFEIRDCIFWHYGSGFPKSLDIGKAIDKAAGAEREVTGTKSASIQGNPFEESYPEESKQVDITAPATPEAQQWDGWGTALKPSTEIFTLARKPLSEKTVAANVLKWGTGGINMDACRVGDNPGYKYNADSNGTTFHGQQGERIKQTAEKKGAETIESTQGRFPANLIHDGSEEVVGLFPVTGQAGNNKATSGITAGKSIFGIGDCGKRNPKIAGDNGGSAARFFYCAKASPAERNAGLENMPDAEKYTAKAGTFGVHDCFSGKSGDDAWKAKHPNLPKKNNHPTVKPVALMEYLIKLITPPNGTVLDPFMGSGTTGVACVKTNRNFIGIELDEAYFQLAKKRIETELNRPRQLTLFD